MAYNKEYFTNIVQLFGGMDVSSTPDVAAKRGKAEYILNCYNHPEGGVAKLFGRIKHNSVTIGANAEITGIFDLGLEATRSFFCIAENKFYKDNAGTWDDKTGSAIISDDKNNLWDFSKFQDRLIGTSLHRDNPIEHDGATGNVSNVSNMPAGKFNKVLAKRLFSINTKDQPKLGYWSGIGDRTSWDETDDFLNFKGAEGDDAPVSGASEHLNNIIIGKESSVFRVYHTGTIPSFKYYRIDDKTGVAGHFTMQSIPPAGTFPARLIWMGKDNFYQLIGDTITSIGDDIKPFFGESHRVPFLINLARLRYCVSGIIKDKNLYFCAFSSGSNMQNDYCVVLDYKNMLWALCNFPVNYFATRQVGGRGFLYSGTYDGFIGRHDPSSYANLGAAYDSEYRTHWLDWGDPQLEKKVRYLIGLLGAIGNFTLAVGYRTNLATSWTSLGDFTMSTGGEELGVDWALGTSTLGGADLAESVLELLKRFKRIQLKFTQTTINHYFRLYALGFLHKPVKGYRIG